MPYPYFQELVSFHSDPEAFFKPKLSEEDIKASKNRIQSGLEKLRSSSSKDSE